MASLLETVQRSITGMLQTVEFSEWARQVRLKDGDWILVNNSLLLRKDLSLNTRKNSQYPGIKVTANGERFSVGEISVTRPERDLNVVFRKVSLGENVQRTPLRESVALEVRNLGRMVTCLVGPILAEPFQVQIDHSRFSILALDPRFEQDIAVSGSEVRVRTIASAEHSWQELRAEFLTLGLPQEDIESFAPLFDDAYNRLRSEYQEKIVLPTNPDDLEGKDTILSRIVTSLRDEISRYEVEVNAFLNTNSEGAYHEVLRIAYNFAEALVDVLRLIVGICDLKPILLWLTCGEQMQLLDAFQRELPWIQLRKKPSLKEYRDTIGAARNHRFHKLLSFPADLVADLQGVAIAARSLKMFTPYRSTRSRNKVQFDYVDREIVELLTTFSRAPEHEVANEWWERNLKVMRATLELVSAFEQGLCEVTRATFEEGREVA